MVKKKDVNLALLPAMMELEAAEKEVNEEGKISHTDLYSTGDTFVDEYLGGGYGRHNGYEIVTVFGDTGMNKSTFASSMIIDPARSGVKVAYCALEDDRKDVVKRIYRQCGCDDTITRAVISNVFFLPDNDGYTLEDMSKAIEELFSICDIVVIDPLQFIFEASVEERGETEFNRQRLFMRRINTMMKKTNKTLIIVSHTAKRGGKNGNSGLDRIIGSSAVAQVSTKVIEIGRDDNGERSIRLWKNRFSFFRTVPLMIELRDLRIRNKFDTASEKNHIRNTWINVG